MLDISATLDALLAGRHLNLAVLFYFDFTSGAKGYWLGPHDIAIGGITYTGKAISCSVDFGSLSVNGAAENFRIIVSGVDQTWLGAVEAEQQEVIGREVRLSFQFFTDDWTALDVPVLLRTGRMQSLRYDDSNIQRSVTVECESIFIARGLAPLTYLSDKDQQRRFPGDIGLSRLYRIQGQSVVQWPTFS